MDNRDAYVGIQRLLLDNLQESLSFFTVKLATHSSLIGNQMLQTHLKDPKSGLITFQMFHKFCNLPTCKDMDLKPAATQLKEYVSQWPACFTTTVQSRGCMISM